MKGLGKAFVFGWYKLLMRSKNLNLNRIKLHNLLLCKKIMRVDIIFLGHF